jgi:hypothetical protein
VRPKITAFLSKYRLRNNFPVLRRYLGGLPGRKTELAGASEAISDAGDVSGIKPNAEVIF